MCEMSHSAIDEEIKKAYRKGALIHHAERKEHEKVIQNYMRRDN